MQVENILGLIQEEELQYLQEEFCQVTGVCACCLDRNGKKITVISGTEEQKKQFIKYEAEKSFSGILERVEEGSLEDLAVEELPEGGSGASIAIRISGKTMLYWLVLFYGENDRFFPILDLLRDSSITLLRNKISCFSAEAESRRSRFAELEMERNLHTIEATTQIVQLLDSEERMEKIMDKWLRVLGEHLKVDSAVIFYLYREKGTMDVAFEWLAEGKLSYFDRTRNQPLNPWLLTDKPLVYSSDTAASEYWENIRKIGVRAMMLFPIGQLKDKAEIVVALNHREKKHNWNMPEIKFTSDAVKVLQSIVTRKQQKNSLEGSYQAMEAILDNVSCAVYVTDKQTEEVLFGNRRLQNTFAAELKNGQFSKLLHDGIENGKENGYYEIYHMFRERWYDLSFKEITWVDGRQAVLYSMYDITDKKLYQRKIEQQAYTDFLTGLYNRMCCERDLARQIDEAKKTGKTGALLYLDLDDFKHINDGLGHQYGDVLLKAISHAVQRIRGIENTCYRMGGDEFVIVVPPEHYENFEQIVENIRKIFEKPWFLKDADYYCTMSMGIVTFPDLGDSVADLIKKADIAMYEAKKSGKNRVARYNEGINSSSGRRLDMEKNMRDAAGDDYREFEIYYQPIVDVEENRCAGAEALIRWNSTKLGFIPPTEFIPLAEYLGLINPIGNHVLKEACRQCRKWNEAGFPDYKVNVNLSVVQLLQPDVVELVEAALEETGIEPRNLTLEVTESLAINDMDRMKKILERIKSLGVKIALDDFGTGYSSLNHIREIPFDVIKVDQSFVKELANDAYSQSFVKMVAELAQTLGVNICVEGIETQAQYRVVREMKVKYIQGFYFDRPMQQCDFEKKYVCQEKACIPEKKKVR